ncbi:hypothetical protein [uncultured Acinetobacter sp.]|uniref:hypothetical protein n=1 Tax=uncultured Acinetobacter sp. TaxID=165433 RepID=UPI0026352D60|nr:hypothetical protein [uncultured Acinetobacter sp.]
MTSDLYILSVVNIIPAAYLALINALAEVYECGPNNISVPLCDKSGEVTHYGCHSYWRIDDYAEFSSDELRNAFISQLSVELQEPMQAAISVLYERVVVDGDAQENWQAALALNGLSEVLEEV